MPPGSVLGTGRKSWLGRRFRTRKWRRFLQDRSPPPAAEYAGAADLAHKVN